MGHRMGGSVGIKAFKQLTCSRLDDGPQKIGLANPQNLWILSHLEKNKKKIFPYEFWDKKTILDYWVNPTSNKKCPYKKKAERYLRQTKEKTQKRGRGNVWPWRQRLEWCGTSQGVLTSTRHLNQQRTDCQELDFASVRFFFVLQARVPFIWHLDYRLVRPWGEDLTEPWLDSWLTRTAT